MLRKTLTMMALVLVLAMLPLGWVAPLRWKLPRWLRRRQLSSRFRLPGGQLRPVAGGSPKVVDGKIETRYVEYTAAELGLTTSLVGNGTLVTLMSAVPPGWRLNGVQVRRLGTITNGTGTTVLNVGTPGAETAIISGVDIEGAGAADLAPAVVINEATASRDIVARVVTATAAPSAVAGLRIGLELRKVATEA